MLMTSLGDSVCVRLRKTCEYYRADPGAEAAAAAAAVADPRCLTERLEHLERLIHAQQADWGGPVPGSVSW